jgi:hypothetical protein
MRRLLICLAIAGCARAGKENSIIGVLVETTLTQTTSDVVTVGASKLNCHGDLSGFVFENSYYRVFGLADHDITTALHVTEVSFGIDTALAGAGGRQPGTVRVGTYGGAPGAMLDLSLVRPISSVDIQIPDGSAAEMTVPITADIPAAASLIVELFIPDGSTARNQFKIGANSSGERKPGYVGTSDPNCNIPEPTSLKALAPEDEIDVILSVTGTTGPPR